MKTAVRFVFLVLLLCAAVAGLSGCPWLDQIIPHEGEAVSEGEGQLPGEGELPALRFTSADTTQDSSVQYPGEDESSPGTTDENTDGSGGDDAPRDVVEPDVIRQDGNWLYILNQYRGLLVVDLSQEKVVAEVPTVGYPRDLYLVGGRAYILVGYASKYTVENSFIRIDVASRLYVADVSDPAAAHLLGEPFSMDGDFVDSRLVGDVLYAVNAEYQWSYYPGGAVSSDAVRKMRRGAEMGMDAGSSGSSEPGQSGGGTVDPSEPREGEVAAEGESGTVTTEGEWTGQSTSESWVTSVNLADPENIHIVDTVNLAGYGNLIQATPSGTANAALFVAASDNWYWDSPKTSITYVDISDAAGAITVRGSVEVPGYIADRFKMNAYNGVLRVVSASGWGASRSVDLTTVDLADPDALTVLGESSLADAAGESVFATRFDGDRAYVVTYLTRDPLWVIDFSDPANPVVVGELQVPGWSTHIEPRGNQLVALGVDDTAGNVKVSLFDVTDPANPVESSVVSFGDGWAYSSAYYDVKAFTVLDDTIIVPVSGWDYNTGQSYNELQFIGYTSQALTLGGAVPMTGSITRSFEYGTHYYGVTSEELVVIDGADLSAPTVTSRVTLAENVQDVQPLGADLVAEVIDNAQGATIVRTLNAAGETLGEVKVPMAGVTATHAYGQSVVLVATAWDLSTYESYYRVATVDCTDPASPQASDVKRVDVVPLWSNYYWWYDYGMPMPEMGGGMMLDKQNADASIYYPGYYYYPWQTGDSSFVVNGYLVLRCSLYKYGEGEATTAYDETVGSAVPNEGLAIIDLRTFGDPVTVGLGYQVLSVHADANTLYIATQQYAGTMVNQYRLCGKFVSTFDPATLTMGPLANVPGNFLDYNAETGVLLLEDFQYAQNWTCTRIVKSVTWDGGESVEPVDSVELDPYAGTLLVHGGSIFFSQWNNTAYALGSVKVDATGALEAVEPVNITDYWMQVIAAHGDSVFMTVGGNAVARYDLGETPMLGNLTETMGSPSRIRFGETAAYAPLGYAGLATLPLE